VVVALENRAELRQQRKSGTQHTTNTIADAQNHGAAIPGAAMSGANGSGWKYEYRSRQKTSNETAAGNRKKKSRANDMAPLAAAARIPVAFSRKSGFAPRRESIRDTRSNVTKRLLATIE
jgi:hypothetical protein